MDKRGSLASGFCSGFWIENSLESSLLPEHRVRKELLDLPLNATLGTWVKIPAWLPKQLQVEQELCPTSESPACGPGLVRVCLYPLQPRVGRKKSSCVSYRGNLRFLEICWGWGGGVRAGGPNGWRLGNGSGQQVFTDSALSQRAASDFNSTVSCSKMWVTGKVLPAPNFSAPVTIADTHTSSL